MQKKIYPWLRLLIILLPLVLGQFQTVMAQPVVPAAPVERSSDPVRQTLPQECKIRVTARAIKAENAGDPIPPPVWAQETLGWPVAVEGVDTFQVGDTLTIWLFVGNATSANIDGYTGGCGPAEMLTAITVESFTIGGQAVPVTLGTDTLEMAGDYTTAVVNYVIQADDPSPLEIKFHVSALDSNPDDDAFQGAVEDGDGLTAPSPNGGRVTIVGPAFQVVEFTPSTINGAPGDFVDFTLQIRNIRPNNTIAAINVSSSTVQFTVACDAGDLSVAGHFWTDLNGTPITQLAYNEVAQCVIQDVPIPPQLTAFTVSGDVTVTDQGGLAVTLPVTSSPPVTIKQPGINVTKVIESIRRGGQPVSPPAAVGDVITYTITVENTGDLVLDNILINDSLTGPIFIDPTTQLPPFDSANPNANKLVVTTTHTVTANSQDPLNNMVTVSARVVGVGAEVDDSASVSVDILDSALEVSLIAVDPLSGAPVNAVVPPQEVEFRLTLRNIGTTTITGIDYVNLSLPLRTYGTPPPLGINLVAGEERSFSWTYTITGSAPDTDPLINTIRVRGTGPSNALLYGQDQAVIDLTNADILLTVTVNEPPTPTVLRGGEVIYEIAVVNRNSSTDICNVRVDQFKVDPDTGQEKLIIADVPLLWPGAPGQLGAFDGDEENGGADTATGVVTYLVTGSDKDPLNMIFEVTATSGCPGGSELTDRTSVVLDISDVQVNAELIPNTGDDDIAQVGENVTFHYIAQNVSSVTLRNLTATWCVPSRNNPAFCDQPFNLTQTSLGSFETVSGDFPSLPGLAILDADATANPFSVRVTLIGTDNKNNQVAIITSVRLTVASPDLVFDVTGPTTAVVGDTETFSYHIAHKNGLALDNVNIYNMLIADAGSPTGYLLVKHHDSVPPSGLDDSFQYQVRQQDVAGDTLTMKVLVTAELSGATLQANDTLDVGIVPILQVLKVGDAAQIPGEKVTYQVTIQNNSKPAPANPTPQTVTIAADGYQDDVLEGAPYNVVIDHSDFNGGVWPSGTPGVLNAGDSVTGTFEITLDQNAPNPLVNVFVVTGTRSSDNATVSGLDDHSLTVSCPLSVTFQVTNTDDDPDDVLGETLHWKIFITNNSSSTINNINVTETLHYGTDGQPGTPPITWPGGQEGTLGPGQTAAIQEFDEQITNKYYPMSGEAFMSDTVAMTFTSATGAQSCSLKHNYPIWSPIWILKFPDPLLAFTGQTINYEFFLANVTEMDDPGPYLADKWYINSVTDELLVPNPIPFDFNRDGTIGDNETAGPLLPSDPNVQGREPLVNTVPYVVKASDPDELTNTVYAEFPDPADPGFTFYTWSTATVFTGEALKLTKVPSVTQATAGTEITYDYTITNISPYTVSDIEFVDTPIGTLIPSAQTNNQLVTLVPNQSIQILDVPYTIPVTAPDPLVNTATAKGKIALPDGSTPEISSSITVSVDLIDPDVKVIKEVRDHATGDPLPDNLPSGGDGQLEGAVGQEVDYCFTVRNNNSSNTTYVGALHIEDALLTTPEALQAQFEAALDDLPAPVSGGPRSDGNGYRLYGGEEVSFCYVPNFPAPPGQEQPSLTLQRELGDPLTNVVKLTGTASSGTSIYTDDEVTVDLQGTDLLISKIPSQPLAFVGDEITYTVRIENRNTSTTITDITLTDAFLGGAPSPIPPEAIDWTNNCSNGDPGVIANGDNCYAEYVYTYTVRPTDPDPLTNIVTATGFLAGDPQRVVEDSSRATVAITASQLLVRKTATPSVAKPGDTVAYEIAITNVGAVDVANIVADDMAYGQTRHFEGSDLTDNNLRPFETAFIYYTVTMPQGADLLGPPVKDPYINTITVTGEIINNDGSTSQVSATATESVDILQPNIRINKTALIQAAASGANVTYDITITNIGGETETLSGLVFRDLLPDGSVAQTVNLETDCPGTPQSCPFVYGDQPYGDYDSDPNTPDTPNPKAGQRYIPYNPADPTSGLKSREQLLATVTLQVPNDWAQNEFTNVAEIVGTLASDPQTTVQDRASATIDIREEGLLVEKIASTAAAPVGATVSYTVRVTNVGGVPFDRLVITDAGMSGGSTSVTIENGFPESAEDVVPGPDTETLDPNEVFEYTYTHTLSNADNDPYVNRVTVTGYGAGATVVNLAEAIVDIQRASVDVEKFVCAGTDQVDPPTQPDPGCAAVVNVADATPDVVTYYLHIRNTSNTVPLQNITLNDSLFGGAPPVGPVASLEPDDGADNSGPDEVWLAYTYTVPPGSPDPLVNLVTASAQAVTGGATVQDTDTAELNLVTGDLQLVKTADKATAVVGEVVTYSFTLTHTDPTGDPIDTIEIIDPLSGDSAPICSVAQLAAGATVTPTECSFTYTVTAADNSPLVNTAVATGTQGGVPVSDTASHTLTIVTPGLSVSKTADRNTARVGDTVTYTYRVENTGTSEIIFNLDVTDSDPLATFNAPWPDRLAPGQVEVRTSTHTITAQDPDPYVNTVTVNGTQGQNTISSSASATVFIATGDLVVSNVPSAPYVVAGGSVTFTYTITNLGTDPVTDVLTGLNLSDGLCTASDPNALNSQLPSTTLNPGASVTVFCTVTAPTSGTIVSTLFAQAMTSDPTPVAVSDTALAQVDVITGGLLVTKTADKMVVDANDSATERTITYTIEVTNLTSETLDTFDINDPVLNGITAPPSLLLPGQSFTRTGTFLVSHVSDTQNPPPDSVTNTVTVTAHGATTDMTYSDSDSVSVAVITNTGAQVVLTKAVDKQLVVVNGTPTERTLTYTLQARNISSDTLTGVVITDTRPDGTVDTINVPDMGPGNVATFTRTVVVPTNWTQPTFTNSAEVSVSGEVHDDASAEVLVQLVTLEKTAASPSVVVGGEISYTFTVTNLSQGQVTGVSLDDPQVTTWDTTLPSTINGGATVTATARVTVPTDYTGATFDNTAQVFVNNELQDEDTASVTVLRTGIDVTIPAGGIYQPDGSTNLQTIQTGEPARVTFVLTNTGVEPITDLTYNVTIGIPDANPAPVCEQIAPPSPVTTLNPGSPVTITCEYTPPIGLASYRTAGGLTPDVTVTASGKVGTETVSDSDSEPMTLVDLQLQVELSFLVNDVSATIAKPGDVVRYTVQLTNLGASPIGCGASVPDDAACHLSVVSNDVTLNNLLAALDAQIADVVLQPNDGQTGGDDTISFNTATGYTVLSTDTNLTYQVTAEGGYWTQALETADVLDRYVVHDDHTATLTIERASLVVTLTAAPIPPVFGQTITYQVTVRNTGTIPLTNVRAAYLISPLAAVPNEDGIMLIGHNQRQASGFIALNMTTIPVNGVATGILAKPEDQTRPYAFIVNVTATETGAQVFTQTLNLTPLQTGTPTPTGTITATVDPSTLDPTAIDPQVTKTSDVTTAQPGGAVTWTITVRNGSTAVMQNVILQDAVPNTLTLGSAAATRGVSVIEGNLVTVTIGNMNPGETVTVTVSTTINTDAGSPANITNTACAMRAGGAQICQTATVSLGPGVSTLPSTGIASGPRGFRLDGLLGLLGALLLLMSAQPSRRRQMLALLFVLVALAAVIGAVALLVAQGGEEPSREEAANVTPAPTNTPPARPSDETAAPAETDSTPPVEPPATSFPVIMDFPPTATPYVAPPETGPRTLMIPKLGEQFKVPIPIVRLPIEDRQWDVSGLGYYIGWLEGTTWLEPSWGNTVLVGHVQLGFENPGPFWGLGDLVPGDEIIVREGDTERVFVVTGTRLVDPGDWTVTAPTTGPTLTLITCTEWEQSYGVFSKRMVVQAVPAETNAG